MAQDNLFLFEIGPTLFLAYIVSFLSLVSSVLCFCLPGPPPNYHDDYSKPKFSFAPSGGDSYTKRKAEKGVAIEYI